MDTQRLRAGDGKPVPFRYASGVSIEVGDTLFTLSSGGPVVPVSSISGAHVVLSGLARFAGIAADKHLATDVERTGVVLTDGEYNLTLVSGSVQPGAHLQPAGAASGLIGISGGNQWFKVVLANQAGESFAVVTASGGGDLSTVRARVQGVVAGPRSFKSGY